MHWNKILNHYFCIAAVIYTTILNTYKLILGLKSINLTWQVTELSNDYFRWHFTNLHASVYQYMVRKLLTTFDLFINCIWFDFISPQGDSSPLFLLSEFLMDCGFIHNLAHHTDGMAVMMSVMPEMQRACHFHMLPSYRPTGRMCLQQTWQQAETVLHQQVLTKRAFIYLAWSGLDA